MDILTVRNVTWRRDQLPIIQNINWDVASGEHWVLIGSNGSGKSTLLNMINGYIWPSEGSVQVLGSRYGSCDLRTVRRHIGWVNAAFGERILQSQPQERAIDVVLSGKFASVGIYDEVTPADDGDARHWLTVFGCAAVADKPFAVLSQGERQRVLLARAWMARPTLLILDEPCSGLDLAAREALLRAIHTLARQPDSPTLIYVTHHVEEVLPVFTHALVMKAGQIVTSGPVADVLADEPLTEAFGVPLQVKWIDGRPWVTVHWEP